MFKEETATGLPKKLTKNEQAARQQQQSGQSSPTKRQAKPTGKRTGGRPFHKRQHSRGMSLKTVENTRSENKTTGKTLRLKKTGLSLSSSLLSFFLSFVLFSCSGLLRLHSFLVVVVVVFLFLLFFMCHLVFFSFFDLLWFIFLFTNKISVWSLTGLYNGYARSMISLVCLQSCLFS